MDWIVTKIFGLDPLMKNHTVAQAILSDKTAGWFREVVLASGRGTFKASDFNQTCEAHSITIPGTQNSTTEEIRNQTIGRLLSATFKKSNTVTVDQWTVTKTTEPGGHAANYKEVNKYTIS